MYSYVKSILNTLKNLVLLYMFSQFVDDIIYFWYNI